MNRASSATGWVRNPDGTLGWTWNPITGCLNGCEYCYARKLANGRLRSRYLVNRNVAPFPDFIRGRDCLTDPFYPRFWDLRIVDPYAINKPCGIFTVDMGELFGDWIPEDWQEQVFAVIKTCPQHRFYLLTKQPQNLIKFSPFPKNCWVGISAINNFDFTNGIGYLGMIKAKIKFVSFEPLLSWNSFTAQFFREYVSLVNWVIIGAQTKPYKPPKIEWVEEIVRACDKAGVKVFLKDNLMPLIEASFGRENYLSPVLTPDGDLRQEFPNV